MGYGIFGYVEVQSADSQSWDVYTKLDTGDVPRSGATQLVFGYGSTTTDCATLFKGRGLPLDASDAVREDYCERQVYREPRAQGEYRDMFGHSHVYASELPWLLLDEFPPLKAAADEYERARLLVWFNR